MWDKQRLTLLAVGVLFHLFYLWSIFDIYFVSPLVHGMIQYRSTSQPPAKRLFLIVGDGLRADTTFNHVTHPTTGNREFLAPFIRSLVLNNATYGISHTRMPTESRPGHVAMIAGFYEDVSAVTKGWKENPVDFDSCFNQSAHTYSFGSPDILPMFKDGASNSQKVDAWMYGHEYEDFTQSSIELDAFVFKHLDDLFYNSTTNRTLNDEIRQDGNIFFLHLLGCDTAGHSYRPYSAEYYNNVKYIDVKVKNLVQQVHDFFGDEETAFIFTADHGMSAFGSHGDGHPNNTRTPLVAWGAGLNKPVHNLHPIYDNYTQGWDLSHIKRHDIKQADIASLMSYLIGVNYPANSVGELPLNYISGDGIDKLNALYNNSRSILEQYLVKEQETINSQFLYREYPKFIKRSHKSYLSEIESLITRISQGETQLTADAIHLTEDLMKTTLEGLQYLTTYNWRFIRTIVTFGFVGWIGYAFIVFLKIYILKQPFADATPSMLNRTIFALLGATLNFVLYYQRSPFNFYMYLLFPLYLWSHIFSNGSFLQKGLQELFKNTSIIRKALVALGVTYIYEGIVYGFFHRWVFTLIFNMLAFYPYACGVQGPLTNLYWLLTSVSISTFTLFDAVKIESLNLITFSGLLMVMIAIYTLVQLRRYLSRYTTLVLMGQIFLVIVMILFTRRSVISLQLRKGLPKDSQYGGWATIALSLLIMPLFHFSHPNSDYRVRLLIIYLTFAPVYLILTISFESLFYSLFILWLVQWIEIESQIRQLRQTDNWLQVLRVAVIGFFLLQVAFFGTGNVASISSFSLDSVYRLLPIFDPFPMGTLLILKLLVPYVLLSTALGILNLRLRITDYTVSSLIISTSDILSLNFFYLLKTEGSWLDIGITISNYCLAILSSLFMIILEVVGHVVLRNVKVLQSLQDKNTTKKHI